MNNRVERQKLATTWLSFKTQPSGSSVTTGLNFNVQLYYSFRKNKYAPPDARKTVDSNRCYILDKKLVFIANGCTVITTTILF